MRFNLQPVSFLLAIIGCFFFTVGGFMLFPIALDLWEQGSPKSAA